MREVFDPANYPVGATVYVRNYGGWHSTVARYTVRRITPSGMIVAGHHGGGEVRINKRGHVVGGRSSDVVDESTALEIRREMGQRKAWQSVSVIAEKLERSARQRDASQAEALFAELAAAMQRARDSGSDPKGEDERSSAECEASQSGGEAASPKTEPEGTRPETSGDTP